MPMWDYLAEKPELRAPFDRWMTRQSDQHNAAIVAGPATPWQVHFDNVSAIVQ